MSLLLVLDLVGTFVFAISGATAGVTRRLDLFGTLALSFVAGNVGGITRDVLIGSVPPAAISDWRYLAVSLLAGVITFYWSFAVDKLSSPVLVFDAAGLALFAVSGAQKALAFGLDPVMAALLGMVTGVGGGMVRDVLVAEIPTVLRADIYAVAALAGAAVVVVGQLLHIPPTATTIVGALLCFGLRLIAIHRGWRLPIAKRPNGRPPKHPRQTTRRFSDLTLLPDESVAMNNGQQHHAAHEDHDAHRAHGGKPGHDKHAGHSIAMFRDRFWLSFILTIPTLVWGHMLPRIFGYSPPEFPGSHWIAPALGTAVFLYGGLPFVQGGIRELRARLPGMMSLIALAISVAFVFSIAVTLGFPGMPLWEELATLVTIMLLGHWIEMRSINQAQGALAELAKLLPGNAVRITLTADGAEHTEDVPLEALADGDLVLVRPGASIPADGEVREGRSNVNEAMITGESRPVLKAIEDHVIAGTVNGEGSLRVAVTGTGERTALAGIMRLVEQAQTSRSRAQVIADRAAYWLTLVALGVGVVTFIAWLIVGAEPAYAVERLVTVLVIACPHALGLAVPLVIAISTTIGARNGLLVRDRRGLEEARLLDAVVFDKTGTLTLGEHRVVGVRAAKGVGDDEALRLAAGVEQDAEHPVAKAIVASAIERGVTVPRVTGFEALPGHGVQADFGGRRLAVGGPNLLRRDQILVPAEIESFATGAAQQAQSVVYLVENRQALAAFAVADAVRPESAEAVRQLHAQGIEVVMLTGDARAVADSVGRKLGIDTVFAEVLPQDKVVKIQELQQQNKRVAMVGDGVNDAPALVAADVGIAIGAGTEVAVEAGDVVLVRSDPRDIPRIIALSRATYQKMVQNLWWASGYNIVAIPLAAGVLAPVGIVLSPAVGAVLMSVSTVIVAINAQLLRRTVL